MSTTDPEQTPNPDVSRRHVIGAATAGIVSASLPAAATAASAGGGEGVSSGSGIIASAVQGVSNTTVTPQAVVVSGVNYNVYRFTSDGSFTVSGGSLNADVLLIGGGGGGGNDSTGNGGGGGGAGEVLPLTSKSFVAGNYVVTVGQGGAAANDGTPSKITYGSGAVSPGSTWESEARKGLKGVNAAVSSGGAGGLSGDQFAGGTANTQGGGGGGGSTSVGLTAAQYWAGGVGGNGDSIVGYWSSSLSVGGGGGGGGGVGGSASFGGGQGEGEGQTIGAGTDGTGGGGGGAYYGTASSGGDGAVYIRILA